MQRNSIEIVAARIGRHSGWNHGESLSGKRQEICSGNSSNVLALTCLLKKMYNLRLIRGYRVTHTSISDWFSFRYFSICSIWTIKKYSNAP